MTPATETRPRGKRGQQPAPYATTHCRVPVPIKMQVQAMAREFREKAWAQYRQQQNSRP